jgi:hypothetical protein
MATVASVRSSLVRPTTVTAAVLLTVFVQLASVPFFFAPGADEIPAFAIVLGIVGGVLSLVGAWGMWNLRRWGMVLTFVLTALNTLTAVPGLFEPPSGWILGELIALLPVGVAILVLIALPSSRRAFQS